MAWATKLLFINSEKHINKLALPNTLAFPYFLSIFLSKYRKKFGIFGSVSVYTEKKFGFSIFGSVSVKSTETEPITWKKFGISLW